MAERKKESDKSAPETFRGTLEQELLTISERTKSTPPATGRATEKPTEERGETPQEAVLAEPEEETPRVKKISRIVQENFSNYFFSEYLPQRKREEIQQTGLELIAYLDKLLDEEKPPEEEMLERINAWLQKFNLDRFYTLNEARDKATALIALREKRYE
jgi:hypothetical protein